MTKIGWTIVFLFLLIIQVTAQSIVDIKVTARKTPLSQILIDLKESYGLQFAFDSDLLSRYKISVYRTFHSEIETLAYLVKNLPLKVEKSGDVFLIIPVSEKAQNNPGQIRVSGQVMEAKTYEPLPYSYILINQKAIQSDEQGHFNFIASADSSLNLQISHLGYFIYDTTLTQSINKQFLLMPRMERIQEVQVYSNPIEKSTLIGDQAGHMKINHQIAPILPGHGDNSVFNLLRLLPGVLASGEQSNDLLIWGAYESHSRIQFDGFTIFGLKNFNDNISVVNPLMVKNIEVMKGGYQARYGGRVGGIVDISGKDGTFYKPTFTFEANSTTLNSLLQIPLSRKSVLLAAYRQTYYPLYDETSITLYSRNYNGNSNGNGIGNSSSVGQSYDFNVLPDFKFRDGNLKYSFKGEDGSRFAASLYGGGDLFLYDMNGEVGNILVVRSEEEENAQFGGSLQFAYPWKNGDVSNVTASYSLFKRQAFEQNTLDNSRTDIFRISKEVDSENRVDEMTITAEQTLGFRNGHKVIVGASAINNSIVLLRESLDGVVLDLDSRSPQFVSYVQDELPIGKQLDINTGVRLVYASKLKKWYVEPRVSASLRLFDDFKINASWGLYNQFMSKTSVVDSANNIAYFWTNADDVDIPVLSAEHFVAGISYNRNGFTASTEGFYKTTKGLSRYYGGGNRFEEGFYQGDARSYGLDFYMKKEYKRHMAWVSYTLSKVEEHYPFYVQNYYRLAPHHQTHELKVAAIVNMNAFYVSANYVYGSGFERFNTVLDDGTNLGKAYNRVDAAAVYRFKPGKVKAEAGISILNIFDADNIKFSNISTTTVDDISLVGIYADAMPFTPAVFLKVEL
jgi:hypothetical protein